jgi:2-polyprenyl-3-methyl-5-hydroxy-6-metoxy-1,4-benzoquinol methylase
VLDIGCGTGVWLAAWRASGVESIVGIDGDTVNPNWLHIPKDCFHALDLTKPVHLYQPGQVFDLAMSPEVAEHIPAEYAEQFLDSLVRHAPVILFSAAIPH